MNETMMYDEISVVAELNRVEGFDPRRFMREIMGEGENAEKQLYLDVKFRKLWFRLKYPGGKIKKSIIKLTEQLAIVESRVYLDKNDSDENYVASAMAQRWYSQNDKYGSKYVELAETASVGRALADAGFGLQFCDIGEESDPAIVDAAITAPGQEATPPVQSNPNQTQSNNPIAPPPLSAPIQATPVAPPLPATPAYTASSPLEEICKLMTVDEAKTVMIDCTANKGKTLGQVAVEKPGSIKWYAESYNGPNNLLRAGAKVLMQAAS